MNYADIIKEKVEIMGQSFLQKDFHTFVEFTYPTVVEMMGGKQKIAEAIAQGIEAMEAEGNSFVEISFGEPSEMIIEKEELQCTISQALQLKVPGGKFMIQSTLIAISIDHGRNWHFIDTSDKDIQMIKSMLPSLSERLVIPPLSNPVFYPEVF